MTKQIPLWLKILSILILLSVVFSILGAVSEFLIPTVFLVALILFPGKDRENPRLLKLIPWLWGLGFILALSFLSAEFFGKELLPAGSKKPTQLELWATIIWTPVVLWSFIKRIKLFRPLMILSTISMVAIGYWEYLGSAQDLKATVNFAGDLIAELILAIYLLAKFKPRMPQQ